VVKVIWRRPHRYEKSGLVFSTVFPRSFHPKPNVDPFSRVCKARPRLGYHLKLGLCRTKTVAATISIQTHTHTPPTLPKTPRISATIKSKFNFKNIFSHIVYNVEYEIDFVKNRGARAPLDPPLQLLLLITCSVILSFLAHFLFNWLAILIKIAKSLFITSTVKLQFCIYHSKSVCSD